MAKNWLPEKNRDRLFGFAEGAALCVGAKPNVLPKAFEMRLAKIELTRPEKSLQLLLLILLFIYKVKISPDMSLQFVFSSDNNSSRFVSLEQVLLHDEPRQVYSC